MRKKTTFLWCGILGLVAALTGCDKKGGATEGAPSSSAPTTKTGTPSAPNPETSGAIGSANTGPACDIGTPGDCEKACLGGRTDACGKADALLRQPGAHDDPAKRVTLNQKGCDLGDGKSCSRLGSQYDKGDGVAKEPAKALANWELACSKDYGNGCFLAGSYYGDPLADRPQDMVKAATLLAKGCTLGVKAACDAKDEPIIVAEIDDVASAPSKWEGKHVYIKNVAVRRNSPTSGVTLKPGGSPSLDGIPSIVASDADDTRKKWLKLPTPVKGVTVKFVEARVEKQMARDERARLVVIDLGDVVP